MMRHLLIGFAVCLHASAQGAEVAPAASKEKPVIVVKKGGASTRAKPVRHASSKGKAEAKGKAASNHKTAAGGVAKPAVVNAAQPSSPQATGQARPAAQIQPSAGAPAVPAGPDGSLAVPAQQPAASEAARARASSPDCLRAVDDLRDAFLGQDRLAFLGLVDSDYSQGGLQQLEQSLIDNFLRFKETQFDFVSKVESQDGAQTAVRARWTRIWLALDTNQHDRKEGVAVFTFDSQGGRCRLLRIEGDNPFVP